MVGFVPLASGRGLNLDPARKIPRGQMEPRALQIPELRRIIVAKVSDAGALYALWWTARPYREIIRRYVRKIYADGRGFDPRWLLELTALRVARGRLFIGDPALFVALADLPKLREMHFELSPPDDGPPDASRQIVLVARFLRRYCTGQNARDLRTARFSFLFGWRWPVRHIAIGDSLLQIEQSLAAPSLPARQFAPLLRIAREFMGDVRLTTNIDLLSPPEFLLFALPQLREVALLPSLIGALPRAVSLLALGGAPLAALEAYFPPDEGESVTDELLAQITSGELGPTNKAVELRFPIPTAYIGAFLRLFPNLAAIGLDAEGAVSPQLLEQVGAVLRRPSRPRIVLYADTKWLGEYREIYAAEPRVVVRRRGVLPDFSRAESAEAREDLAFAVAEMTADA